MEKNVKNIPIKVRNSKEYVFHFIGTMSTIRYNVDKREIQSFIGDTMVTRRFFPMSFENFEEVCKTLFLKSFGWN